MSSDVRLNVFKLSRTYATSGGIAIHIYGDAFRNDPDYFIKRVNDTMLCPECGGREFNLYPDKFVVVSQGGKPYIECANCGETSHL